MTVVGIEKVHYMSKKSNQWVDGINLHCVSDSVETDKISGQTVERVFISSRSAAFEVASKLKLGCHVRFFYNRYGNVESVLDESGK